MNQTVNANSNRALSHDQILHLVLTALFIAFILLLGFTPIGMIPLGFINVSLLCTPVVVGTLLLGWQAGLALGFSFGAVSAIKAFTATTGLVAPLLAGSPVLTLVMCFVPRLLVPLAAHLVYGLVAKGQPERSRAVPFAAVAGSLTNTILYLGMMLLFYVLLGIDAKPVLGLIGGTGLIAGSAEAVAAALISTPVLAALWRVQRRK